MANTQNKKQLDLALPDLQLLESIGQEVLHATRRKIILSNRKKIQINSLQQW